MIAESVLELSLNSNINNVHKIESWDVQLAQMKLLKSKNRMYLIVDIYIIYKMPVKD